MRTIKSAGLALTLLFLFGISGNTVAQTEETKKQTPEVEQLKQRLQQLEETVQQLKGQIGALECTINRARTAQATSQRQ